MPRNFVAAVYDRRKTKIHAGGDAARRPDGKCHREYTAIVAALYERKSAVIDRRYNGKGEKVV
jgi:hypothetical protein